jgi:hypothetical protein
MSTPCTVLCAYSSSTVQTPWLYPISATPPPFEPQHILSICNLFNIVIDSVKFRFVESSFFISAVIAVIASSVLCALARTVSMFSNNSTRSVLAAEMRALESAFVEDCVITSLEMSASREARWLWRDCATGVTEASVDGWEKRALRWSMGS